MGFSRQEYWSGLPCPPPEDLSDPGTKPLCLLHWQAGSLPIALPRKPSFTYERLKFMFLHYQSAKKYILTGAGEKEAHS